MQGEPGYFEAKAVVERIHLQQNAVSVKTSKPYLSTLTNYKYWLEQLAEEDKTRLGNDVCNLKEITMASAQDYLAMLRAKAAPPGIILQSLKTLQWAGYVRDFSLSPFSGCLAVTVACSLPEAGNCPLA